MELHNIRLSTRTAVIALLVAAAALLCPLARLPAGIVAGFAAMLLAIWFAMEAIRQGGISRGSDNRYRLLVESSPLGIYEIDLEGRLLSMNKAGLKMLGLSDEAEVRDKPYLGLVGQRDSERIGMLLRDTITHGATSRFEFAAAGEAERHFKSCLAPVRGPDGTVLKLMGMAEEISGGQPGGAHAKIAAAGSFNRDGEWAAAFAHDLSQPLAACSNYLEACLRRVDDADCDRPRLKEMLQLAHEQAVRAGKMLARFRERSQKPEFKFTLSVKERHE